jgi:GT2 family glycosyltransferase
VSVACISVVAVRRTAFDQIGLFDVSFALASDGDWLVRARRAGVMLAVIPELVCRYRIHERNASHDIARMQHELLRAVRGARASELP